MFYYLMFANRDNANVTWSVPGASSVSEGYYTCNASNAAGYSAASTYLDVKGIYIINIRRGAWHFKSSRRYFKIHKKGGTNS